MSSCHRELLPASVQRIDDTCSDHHDPGQLRQNAADLTNQKRAADVGGGLRGTSTVVTGEEEEGETFGSENKARSLTFENSR